MQLSRLGLARGGSIKLPCSVLLSSGQPGKRLPKLITLGLMAENGQYILYGGGLGSIKEEVARLAEQQPPAPGCPWQPAFGMQVGELRGVIAAECLLGSWPACLLACSSVQLLCSGRPPILVLPDAAAACSTRRMGRCWWWVQRAALARGHALPCWTTSSRRCWMRWWWSGWTWAALCCAL